MPREGGVGVIGWCSTDDLPVIETKGDPTRMEGMPKLVSPPFRADSLHLRADSLHLVITRDRRRNTAPPLETRGSIRR